MRSARRRGGMRRALRTLLMAGLLAVSVAGLAGAQGQPAWYESLTSFAGDALRFFGLDPVEDRKVGNEFGDSVYGGLLAPSSGLEDRVAPGTMAIPAAEYQEAFLPLPVLDVDSNGNLVLVKVNKTTRCHICVLISHLEHEGQKFTILTLEALAPPVLKLFRTLLAAWIVWTGILYMAGKPPPLEQLAVRAFAAVVIVMMLTFLDLWVHYVYLFVRDILVGIAQILIHNISGAQVPANAGKFSLFAQLYGMVETSVLSVVAACWFIMIGAKTASAAGDGSHLFMWEAIQEMLQDPKGFTQSFVNIFFGIALLLPWTFVMLIFAAYVVEAIFKFLAVTALAPVWLVSAFFQRTRSFLEAAIRLYISGGLTVVFAAVAMGFTLAVTDSYIQPLFTAVMDGKYLIMTWGYWAMLVLGFISVLLHLKAATLASNISGANDGAGPAAATVMAGKMTVGLAGAAALRYGGLRQMAGWAGGGLQDTRTAAGWARGGLPGAAIGAAGDIAAGAAGAVSGAGSRAADLARRFSQGRGGNG